MYFTSLPGPQRYTELTAYGWHLVMVSLLLNLLPTPFSGHQGSSLLLRKHESYTFKEGYVISYFYFLVFCCTQRKRESNTNFTLNFIWLQREKKILTASLYSESNFIKNITKKIITFCKFLGILEVNICLLF